MWSGTGVTPARTIDDNFVSAERTVEMLERMISPTRIVVRLLLALDLFYVLGAQFLGSTAIRHQTWMVIVAFVGTFPTFIFAIFVGYSMAKSNHPEHDADRAPSSIPARYRVVLFTKVFDRRDVELGRYLPQWRKYIVVYFLFAAMTFIFMLSLTVSRSGVPLHVRSFSDVAPGFAAAGGGLLTVAMMQLRAGAVWRDRNFQR